MIFTHLTPSLGLRIVRGFDDFLGQDGSGVLAQEFSVQSPRDILHLNGRRGAALLATIIKNNLLPPRVKKDSGQRGNSAHVNSSQTYAERTVNESSRTGSPQP